MTVYATFGLPKLFKTEVVVAESSSVVVLWGSENYPGALAAGDFHAGLVLVPLTPRTLIERRCSLAPG